MCRSARSPRRPSARGTPARRVRSSAVVTTSTVCPRPWRNSASAGAWLAGPPGSGGQIPETTTTLTAGTPLRPSARPRATSARERASTTSQAAANTTVDTRTATAAPVAPHSVAEHDDERDRDERLEPVRDDPQPRPTDRHRQRLRPAERRSWIAAATRTIARGGRRPRRTPFRRRPRTSHGIATKKTGTATTMTAPAHFE